MALEPISGLLKRSVRRAGIDQQTEAAQIFGLYLNFVSRKIGPIAKNRVAPQTLADGVLTIEVRGSALGAELRTLEGELLQALDQDSAATRRAPIRRIVYHIV